MSPTHRQDTGCLVKASIMIFLIFMGVVLIQFLVTQNWTGLLITVPFTATIAISARWLGRTAARQGSQETSSPDL